MHSQIFKYLENVKGESTAHLSGSKRVFVSNGDTKSALTQVALGELGPQESIEEHTHGSMEEYFYFIEGVGEYNIGSEKVIIKPDTFVVIPSNMKHSLINTGDENLRFIYFGIAV